MLQLDTPYKILKYLVKLNDEKILIKNFTSDKIIIHLTDRGFIESFGNKFKITEKFIEKFNADFLPEYNKCYNFLKKFGIEYLENHYTIGEIEKLMLVEENRSKIITRNYSHQQILTEFFGSSKHTKIDSTLSKALKAILSIDQFLEDSKDLQYLSILYPKKKTQYIILCENKNRLFIPRHDYIEFWFAGGKNVGQLKYVPIPTCPIYYLFDWDFDGIGIYLGIKSKYFNELKAFIPSNFKSLMVCQEDVKQHKSKWKAGEYLSKLNPQEKEIVEALLKEKKIIEEQSIQLSNDLLNYNKLYFS